MLSHGMCEYFQRYCGFAEFLCRNGIALVGNDHIGHGNSVSDRDMLGYFGEAGGYMYMVKDLHRMRAILDKKLPDIPKFLLGHSMGSFLLRTYLYTYPADLDAAIISGTGWEKPATIKAGLLLCRIEEKRLGETKTSPVLNSLIFGGYNKVFKPNRTPNDWICSDEQVVDKYQADPLCGFDATVGLTRDMLTGISMNQRKENLEKMDKALPVLFVSGMQDPVGAMGEGVLRCIDAFKRSGMKDVTIRIYPEGRHEMLNESNHEVVYADILRWLEAR